MSVDLRLGRTTNSKRCKWYRGEYIKNQKVTADVKAQGVFYADDSVGYREYYENEGGAVGHIVKTVTITTNDNVSGITINDYVRYDGWLWRVNSIPLIDDKAEQKNLSSRPSATTLLELRR